jgi:hypothetical protein
MKLDFKIRPTDPCVVELIATLDNGTEHHGEVRFNSYNEAKAFIHEMYDSEDWK